MCTRCQTSKRNKKTKSDRGLFYKSRKTKWSKDRGANNRKKAIYLIVKNFDLWQKQQYYIIKNSRQKTYIKNKYYKRNKNKKHFFNSFLKKNLLHCCLLKLSCSWWFFCQMLLLSLFIVPLLSLLDSDDDEDFVCKNLILWPSVLSSEGILLCCCIVSISNILVKHEVCKYRGGCWKLDCVVLYQSYKVLLDQLVLLVSYWTTMLFICIL